jgi:hypothetical protein
MNDFDDVTFGRFARRFAQIEPLVPAPPARSFPPLTDLGPRVSALRRSIVLLGALVLLGGALVFASFGLQPTPTPTPTPTAALTLPPDSAEPEVVLSAYLGALSAGQCDVAEQYIDSPIYRWSDILCGGTVRITEFSIVGEPRFFGFNRLDMDALLTTNGRSIGMAADQGQFTFELQQRASGAWRIVEAHPWPIRLFPTQPPT